METSLYLINKTMKKSDLQAETEYDYKKIEYPNERFLACHIEEKEETLEFTYETEGYHPFIETRTVSKQEKLRILIDAVRLFTIRKEYSFSLNPENLYFDENYRVYVLERDICKSEETQEEAFPEEYKALIGCSMQKKYSFEDYLEGGMSLFKKNKFLKMLMPLETLDEIIAFLEEKYQEISKEIRERRLLVNKNAYISSRVYIVVSILLLIAGAGVIGYYSLYEKPVLEAKLQSEIDFLKGDYIQVIDDLEELSVQQLSYDQKYILSVAYVNTESLTVEQKENILQKLPINGEEKLMEYWIYIGRLLPLEAENIALQRSDDELLLYAYMLEKDLTETDTQMTGEEKAAKLEELNGKIEKLAEKYVEEETEESVETP